MIRIYGPAEFEKHIPRFAEILMDAVDSGAGVSFMKPLNKTDAENFWCGQLGAITEGKTFPIIAEQDGKIAGLVLLLEAWAPNQPHRCDVAKLLVHRDFRRQGHATALMQALEAKARALGLTMINFDAVQGSVAEDLYKALGFICVGYYPGYAYSGDGKLDGTALFYKRV